MRRFRYDSSRAGRPDERIGRHFRSIGSRSDEPRSRAGSARRCQSHIQPCLEPWQPRDHHHQRYRRTARRYEAARAFPTIHRHSASEESRARSKRLVECQVNARMQNAASDRREPINRVTLHSQQGDLQEPRQSRCRQRFHRLREPHEPHPESPRCRPSTRLR